MKIGILTQPLCSNYGGILQNYALHYTLKNLGHEPITINYPIPQVKYSKQHLILSCIKRLIKKILGDKNIIFINIEKQNNNDYSFAYNQANFIKKNISKIDIVPPLDGQFCATHKFDAYIVGSDQVWRPRYSQYILNNFLDFTENYDVIRMSFAASFGSDKWEIPQHQTIKIKRLIANFNAVSVREFSGVNLCRSYLNIDASYIIDPTFLLPQTEYKNLISKTSNKQEYICIYILDNTKKKKHLIRKIVKQYNLPIKTIGKLTKRGYPSVEDWINGIANAKYVITDSFHGTAFSIIFNRQFISINNSARGKSRFDSILSLFNLNSNLISEDYNSIQAIQILEKKIDYERINRRIKLEQSNAINFIKQNLK